MSNWFIFYVHTGREKTVCDYLNEILDDKKSFAFVPQVEIIFKNLKQTRKELKPMFPGYVITETIIDARSFINQTSRKVRSFKHIINLLGKENPDYMALCEEEKKYLLEFCNDDCIIRESVGFIEGDRIYVASGPLQGRESVIKRIDRHKRRAEIELEFMGNLRRVYVALEIVGKM